MVTTKSYTFSNVTGNHTISAEFTTMTQTVTIGFKSSASGNASIRYKIGSGSWTTITTTTSNISVTSGQTITVEAISIASTKKFYRWELNYEGAGESDYSTENPHTETVTEDMTIYLDLQNKPQYTITASAGTGGTITPNGNVTVLEDDSQTFQIQANTGYVISQILVDGSPITL